MAQTTTHARNRPVGSFRRSRRFSTHVPRRSGDGDKHEIGTRGEIVATESRTYLPNIASPDEWLAGRGELPAFEKEATTRPSGQRRGDRDRSPRPWLRKVA